MAMQSSDLPCAAKLRQEVTSKLAFLGMAVAEVEALKDLWEFVDFATKSDNAAEAPHTKRTRKLVPGLATHLGTPRAKQFVSWLMERIRNCKAREVKPQTPRVEVDTLGNPEEDTPLLASPVGMQTSVANSTKNTKNGAGKAKDKSEWFQIKWTRRTLEGFETPVELPPYSNHQPQPNEHDKRCEESKEEFETPVALPADMHRSAQPLTVTEPLTKDEADPPLLTELDEAWVEVKTADGPYFWDRRTNSCTWELPPGICPKWMGQKIPDGRTYYWSRDDMKTYWSLPALQDLPVIATESTLSSNPRQDEEALAQDEEIPALQDLPVMATESTLSSNPRQDEEALAQDEEIPGRDEETPAVTSQEHVSAPDVCDCNSPGDLDLETPAVAPSPTSVGAEPDSQDQRDLLRLFGYSETELQTVVSNTDGNPEGASNTFHSVDASTTEDFAHETPVLPPVPAASLAQTASVPPSPPPPPCVPKLAPQMVSNICRTSTDDSQDALEHANLSMADPSATPDEAPTTSASVNIEQLQKPDTLKGAETCGIISHEHPSAAPTHVATTCRQGLGISKQRVGASMAIPSEGPVAAQATCQSDVPSPPPVVITVVTAPVDTSHLKKGRCDQNLMQEARKTLPVESEAAPASEIPVDKAKDGKIEELRGKLDERTQDSTRLKVEVAILKRQLASLARMRSAVDTQPQQNNDENTKTQKPVCATLPNPEPEKIAQTIKCPQSSSGARHPTVSSQEDGEHKNEQAKPQKLVCATHPKPGPEKMAQTTKCPQSSSGAKHLLVSSQEGCAKSSMPSSKSVPKDDELMQRFRALRQRQSTSEAMHEEEPPLKRQRHTTLDVMSTEEQPLKRRHHRIQPDMGITKAEKEIEQKRVRSCKIDGQTATSAMSTKITTKKTKSRSHERRTPTEPMKDITHSQHSNSKDAVDLSILSQKPATTKGVLKQKQVAEARHAKDSCTATQEKENKKDAIGKAATDRMPGDVSHKDRKVGAVETEKENSILDKFMTEVIYGKPPGQWDADVQSETKQHREGSLSRKRSRRASRGGA